MASHKKYIQDNTLRKLTSYASISVAIALIAVKVGAYLMTGSVALLSSLVDSGADLIASVITAYGVIVAMRPADKEHRFGHGKAESLAALAQSTFIILSAFALLYKAGDRFVSPEPIHNVVQGYIVMGISIGLTALLVALQTYTVRKTGSLAIASDRLHYIGDIYVGLAVMATFGLQEHLNVLWLDPLFAIVIGGILFFGAIKIARLALNVLMDAELPTKDRNKIISLISKVEGVIGVHDLRTRRSSSHVIIEAHVEMDPTITLSDAHVITEAVEAAVLKTFKNADITIHQDPHGHKEKRLDNILEGKDPIS